jgi:RimJ/RimL family protein N-acetyltransferase
MILEGRLVRLRAMAMDDLQRDHAWINDQEVIRHLAARYPVSLAEEERWLSNTPPGNFANGVRLAIDTKEGRHIGNIDFLKPSPADRCAALGIMIGDKEYWSQGYGTDAMTTFLRFGFEQMNLNRAWLHVFAENERAIACYKKCGMQVEGRLRGHRHQEGHYQDVLEMGILREEFEALHRAEGDARC